MAGDVDELTALDVEIDVSYRVRVGPRVGLGDVLELDHLALSRTLCYGGYDRVESRLVIDALEYRGIGLAAKDTARPPVDDRLATCEVGAGLHRYVVVVRCEHRGIADRQYSTG